MALSTAAFKTILVATVSPEPPPEPAGISTAVISAPLFVLERQTDGCFILAYLRIYVKQRGSVHLVKTGGYYLVFYRIGGIGGQSLVHFQDIHVYIHITGRVRRLLLAVYRYALYRSFAAELFPARLLVPGIQGGSG